jgi:hypothetical protein
MGGGRSGSGLGEGKKGSMERERSRYPPRQTRYGTNRMHAVADGPPSSGRERTRARQVVSAERQTTTLTALVDLWYPLFTLYGSII